LLLVFEELASNPWRCTSSTNLDCGRAHEPQGDLDGLSLAGFWPLELTSEASVIA
jgi:hypothetical protein